MKHVLKCNGDESMVSQQFPTTGSNQTFPSLKAVKVKAFLPSQSSCRGTIRFQLKLHSFFPENCRTLFLSLTCVLNAEARTSDPVPKAKPVQCQLQNTGVQKSNIAVAPKWMGKWLAIVSVCQAKKNVGSGDGL